MYKPQLPLFAVLMVLIAAGCKEEPSWKSRVFTQRNLSTNVVEVKIPSEMWERVIAPDKPLKGLLEIGDDAKPNTDAHGGAHGDAHGEAKAEAHGAEAAHGEAPAHGEESAHGDAGAVTDDGSAIAKTSVETDLKPLTVYLIEETRGVFGGRNLKIDFGPGGGDIDLRDFVLSNRGTFRVVFEFAPDAEPEAVKRVWYLSNAQKRKVGPDSVGAGCDTYMDISTFTKKQAEKDGMLIAIGSDRHVSALAGTYVFSVKRGGRVQVSRLTILDSSKRKLMCRS